MTAADPESRDWIDRLAIADLIYRYSDAVTRGDLEHDEALFAADAVLEIGAPLDTRVEGARAIRQLRESRANAELLIHTTYSPVIRLLGPDHAQATSQTHVMQCNAPESATAVGAAGAEVNVEFYGVYYDDIVKIDGHWKFAHRFCQPIYVKTGSLKGQAHTTRSSLPRPS